MPRTSTITPEKFATFGELLRFLRRKADLTQRELSIAVGYSESKISRMEKNERAPDESTLAARFV
ncbi:MAG: helix-turn-helix transcriptional regulator, partial [Chloroflexota bacterium]